MVAKSQRKKRDCIQHRKQLDDEAMQRLIDGKASPEYVRMRHKKLKRILKTKSTKRKAQKRG